MVIKCCVFGCANLYKKKHRKLEDEDVSFLSFHRFPTNLEKKTTWISNVRQINGSTWQPVNSSFVCSEHFDCSSWEKIREDGERKLKFQAAPSIFNNNLSQKSRNDHIYSLKDITNRTISSMEINKLRLSVPDHSYSSKKVCSNRNLSTTASSIKETSVTTLNTAEKDISNTSEIESNLIDNENSDIVLNNSDVFTNTCTIASSNASNILPEMIMEVENAITAETIEEQQIDIMTASLKNENEQLKKELARVKKIADKIHQENNTLRKSNKNLRRRNEILTNIQEKSESTSTKFNKYQKKAMYKKNYRGIHWEPKTLKQALILKLKCGSSGYKEVQKHIPLPSIRTLQRRIKH